MSQLISHMQVTDDILNPSKKSMFAKKGNNQKNKNQVICTSALTSIPDIKIVAYKLSERSWSHLYQSF